jgi:uncharacterized protein (DUF433 family)
VTSEPLVTFADLLEMRFIAHFRKSRLPWSRILNGLPLLRELVFKAPQAGTLVFESDGATIFANALGEKGDHKGIELDSRQHVMLEMLEATFREELRFTPDGAIQSWLPRRQYPHVFCDPNIQFGEPIVAPGVPTAVLYDDFLRYGGNVSRVAHRYGVDADVVTEAARFEADLQAVN